MPHIIKDDVWKQRLHKMNDRQQNILVRLNNKVVNCEGTGMPRKYWCTSCKSSWARLEELFIRFELLNTQHKHLYSKTAFTYPKFNGYD